MIKEAASVKPLAHQSKSVESPGARFDEELETLSWLDALEASAVLQQQLRQHWADVALGAEPQRLLKRVLHLPHGALPDVLRLD